MALDFFLPLPLAVGASSSELESFLLRLPKPLFANLPPRPRKGKLNLPRFDGDPPNVATLGLTSLLSVLKVLRHYCYMKRNKYCNYYLGTGSFSHCFVHRVPLVAAEVIFPLRMISTWSLSTSVKHLLKHLLT